MKECGVFSSRFLLFPLVKVHDVFIIGPVKVPIKIVSKSFFSFYNWDVFHLYFL